MDVHDTIQPEALRAMIREVLAELLATRRGATARPATSPGAAPPGAGAGRVEEVRIADDRDLAAFVVRLATLSEDRRERAALRDGGHRFRLAGAPQGGRRQGPRQHVDKCVLSEARVAELGKAGGDLVLARGVVVTPLARDKARELGLRLIWSD